MGYITNKIKIVHLIIVYICKSSAILTHFNYEASQSRNVRHYSEPLPFPNWELGLREAVYQAFLRERNQQTNLKEYLYAAPIVGRQDFATPFGDIAIVARGQLYSAPGGFQFVQDPYQNDCEGCHNAPPRCEDDRCENWTPQGHERLLALWTVKRIRHRDSKYGYNYELEYKVTPMNIPSKEPFITRNGNFDYTAPGHTFVVKPDAGHYQTTIQRYDPRASRFHRPTIFFNSYDSNQWKPNLGPNYNSQYLPPPPPPLILEQYYDEDPRKAGFPNALYALPEVAAKTTFGHSSKTDQEREAELYRNLIDTLSSKTNATGLPTSTTTESSIFGFPTKEESKIIPLLPTIPTQAAMGISVTHTKNNPMTKTAFNSLTSDFPISMSTVSDAKNFKTRTTLPDKYSEPDPFFRNSITPSTITKGIQLNKPTTTKHTLQYYDIDIFDESTEKSNIKFPDTTNIIQSPGEHVINVVKPPSINANNDKTTTGQFQNSEQNTRSEIPDMNQREIIEGTSSDTIINMESSQISEVTTQSTIMQAKLTTAADTSTKPSVSKGNNLIHQINLQSKPITFTTKLTTAADTSTKPSVSKGNNLIHQFNLQSKPITFTTEPMTQSTFMTTLTIPTSSIPLSSTVPTSSTTPTTSSTTFTSPSTTSAPALVIPTFSPTTLTLLPTTPMSTTTKKATVSVKTSPTRKTFLTLPMTHTPSTKQIQITRRTTTSIPETTQTPMTINLDISTTSASITYTNPFTNASTELSTRKTVGIPKLSVKPIRFKTLNITSSKPTISYTTPLATVTTAKVVSTTQTAKVVSTTQTATITITKVTNQSIKATTSRILPKNMAVTNHKGTSKDTDLDFNIFDESAEPIMQKINDDKKKQNEDVDSIDLEDIFDFPPRQIEHTTLPTTITNQAKIIFSDFYSPSTELMENDTTNNGYPTIASSENISLNMDNIVNTDKPATAPFNTTMLEINEINENKKIAATTMADYNASIKNTNEGYNTTTAFPISVENKSAVQTPCSIVENEETGKKMLDALALSVINNAKSIDYLNSFNNTNSFKNNTVNREKYRRKRIYRVQKRKRT